jgi:hypothetical protein
MQLSNLLPLLDQAFVALSGRCLDALVRALYLYGGLRARNTLFRTILLGSSLLFGTAPGHCHLYLFQRRPFGQHELLQHLGEVVKQVPTGSATCFASGTTLGRSKCACSIRGFGVKAAHSKGTWQRDWSWRRGRLLSVHRKRELLNVQLFGYGEAAAIRIDAGHEFSPGSTWRDCMEKTLFHLKVGRADVCDTWLEPA